MVRAGLRSRSTVEYLNFNFRFDLDDPVGLGLKLRLISIVGGRGLDHLSLT